MMPRLSISELVHVLAQLDEAERLELCDALVDDPRLRDLLEAIDDYLYLETDTLPPLNLQSERNLN
jgi:predicted nucleic acid-binding protein